MITFLAKQAFRTKSNDVITVSFCHKFMVTICETFWKEEPKTAFCNLVQRRFEPEYEQINTEIKRRTQKYICAQGFGMTNLHTYLLQQFFEKPTLISAYSHKHHI